MCFFIYSFEGRWGFILFYYEILVFEILVEFYCIKVYYVNYFIKIIYGSFKDIAVKVEKDYFVYVNCNILVSLQVIEEMIVIEVILLEGLYFFVL